MKENQNPGFLYSEKFMSGSRFAFVSWLQLLLRFRALFYFGLILLGGYLFSSMFYVSATIREINTLTLSETEQQAPQEKSVAAKDGKLYFAKGTEPGIRIDFSIDGENYSFVIGSRFTEVKAHSPILRAQEKVVLLVGFLLFWLYLLPVHRVLREGRAFVSPKILKKARRHIHNLTRRAFGFYWLTALLMFCNQAVSEWLYFGSLSFRETCTIAVCAISFGLLTSAVALLCFDSLILKYIFYFYDEQEIYQLKTDGRSISLRGKLILIAICLNVLPLCLLFYVNVLGNVRLSKIIFRELETGLNTAHFTEMIPIFVMLFFSFVIVLFAILMSVLANRSLTTTLINPVEMLIERMAYVQEGDYSKLTTVLTNDEVGRVKANYNEMLRGLQQREFIRNTFGRFLSIEISRKILETGEINLGGEEVEATVLFSDIRNFTSISESMSAQEVVTFLNEFFARIVAPILQSGGVVNKYIGDCVMAIFGVPERNEMHAVNAVEAALKMKEALRVLNMERQENGLFPIHTGIGIHTGRLVAGNIGSPERLEYTVIGDTVNVASRIETQTKALGADILISEAVYQKMPLSSRENMILKKISGIQMKGRQESVDLYAVQKKS
jgi:class 3 adenylate cyclase